jgi:hypothetical protein
MGNIVKNKASIIAILALCLGAASFFFVGPSFFMGGPSKAEIREATIEVIRSRGATEGVTITPKGICNKQADLFACIVEVTSAGAAPETFVIEMALLHKSDEGFIL